MQMCFFSFICNLIDFNFKSHKLTKNHFKNCVLASIKF